MGYKQKILFIEDERDFYGLAVKELAGSGLEFEPAHAADRAGFAGLLNTFQPDIIVADYHLPDIEGPEILRLALAAAPLAPFIALSGTVSDQQGRELEKQGAFKYLPKDRLGRLPGAVAGAICRLAYTRPRILFVENDEDDYKLERKALDDEGLKYLPLWVGGVSDLAAALDTFSPNLIVADYVLGDGTALDVLRLARQKTPLSPVIAVSGSVGEEKAIELFRAGVADFVLKDKLHRLGFSVRRVLEAMRENIRREAAERDLREAVAARGFILDAVQAPFFLADAKGRAVLGNAAAAAALRLPELAGADIFAAPGEYGAEIKKALQGGGKSGAPAIVEHQSGSSTLETHVYPVPAPEAGLPQYAVISLDITARKQAEAALQENMEVLRLFTVHAPAAIAMLDSGMRYLAVSRRWLADYGLGERDVTGLSHYEVFPEIPDRWKPIHRRCLAGAVERSEEDPFLRADGHTDWLRWEIRPWRKADGSIGGIIIFSENITARKLAELDVQRLNTILSDKNREMEQFLYITTHDLRSPLVNIQGFSRHLEQSVQDLRGALAALPLPAAAKAEIEKLAAEEIPEALKFILSGTHKMDSLLTALLKVARLGRLEPKPETVEMNELLKNVGDSLRFQLEAAGGKITCGALPACLADPAVVTHLFLNLLDNAIKYRHKDRAPAITVSGEITGSRAVYKIADNCSGIAAADLENIWNIFHKHAKTAERKGEGIGLPTVRSLAEKSGGSIRAESKEGEGSVFRLELPAAAEDKNAIR